MDLNPDLSIQQAKKVRKAFISTIFQLLFNFLSIKTDGMYL
jgi:hypothetical protein